MKMMMMFVPEMTIVPMTQPKRMIIIRRGKGASSSRTSLVIYVCYCWALPLQTEFCLRQQLKQTGSDGDDDEAQ